MKPTPQVSTEHSGSFPLTDYHYQSGLERSRAGVKEAREAQPGRAIWKLGAEFLAVEARLDYAIEFALFSLIGGLSAWPIISMLVAVVRMLRNY
jgi:hypothetical protein